MIDQFAQAAHDAYDPQTELQDYLRQSTRILEQLEDPEYPQAGRALLHRFHALRCKEVVREPGRFRSFALYVAFECPHQPSYVKTMACSTRFLKDRNDDGSPRLKRDIEFFASSRHHEMIHALAIDASPALHASPYNGAAGVIMTPLDWVWTYLRMEEDAYAKQAWIASMAARDNPLWRGATAGDPVSVADFEAIRQNGGSLQAALAQAARVSLDKYWGVHDDLKIPMTFRDYYQHDALDAYEHMVDTFLKWKTPVEVARLGPWHLRDIGNSFGPNPFTGMERHFTDAPDLGAAGHETLARIYHKLEVLGAQGPEYWPLLEDALDRKGMTLGGFHAYSRARTLPGQAGTPFLCAA